MALMSSVRAAFRLRSAVAWNLLFVPSQVQLLQQVREPLWQSGVLLDAVERPKLLGNCRSHNGAQFSAPCCWASHAAPPSALASTKLHSARADRFRLEKSADAPEGDSDCAHL